MKSPRRPRFPLDDMGVADSGSIGLAIAGSSAATALGAGVFALCGPGIAVIWVAADLVAVTPGAVINSFGGGIMLPSLLTPAGLGLADRLRRPVKDPLPVSGRP